MAAADDASPGTWYITSSDANGRPAALIGSPSRSSVEALNLVRTGSIQSQHDLVLGLNIECTILNILIYFGMINSVFGSV